MEATKIYSEARWTTSTYIWLKDLSLNQSFLSHFVRGHT